MIPPAGKTRVANFLAGVDLTPDLEAYNPTQEQRPERAELIIVASTPMVYT